MGFDDPLVFLLRPSLLLDVRVEVVVPPLTTLFPDATGKILRNLRPVFSSELLNKLDKSLVLGFGPRSLDQVWVEDLLPSVETLDVIAVLKETRNSFPVACLIADQKISDLPHNERLVF